MYLHIFTIIEEGKNFENKFVLIVENKLRSVRILKSNLKNIEIGIHG